MSEPWPIAEVWFAGGRMLLSTGRQNTRERFMLCRTSLFGFTVNWTDNLLWLYVGRARANFTKYLTICHKFVLSQFTNTITDDVTISLSQVNCT